MTIGKEVNKKSFYGGMEAGKVPDIEMPPLNDQTPINQVANPWDNQPVQSNSNQGTAAVPDEVPQEVNEEMQQENNQEDQVSTPSVKSTPKDSFKALREKAEKAERERDALLNQMLEIQKFTNQQKEVVQKEVQQEENFDFNIDDDTLVEGKHAKKLVGQLRKMQSQLDKYQQQSHQESVEAKIKATYPDFERVVSPENVAILNEEYPEIAQSLKNNPDIYSKAASAYSIMKRFGIYQEREYVSPEKQKALLNSQKPRPLASVYPQQGDSPLSKANAFANGLTEELKAQLRKEMFTSRRNI